MKLKNYITASALVLATLLCGSCDDDEQTVAKAVLASASALNFEAENASQQIITVYSDAQWVMDELPEWISVTPVTGQGTTEVTVSVTDNLREGTVDNPREATIVFRGNTLASRAEVTVSQDGDKYRDCQEYTVDQLPALADETVVIVPEALVTAVSTSGCIVSNDTYDTHIFLETTATVSVGDRVYIQGSKDTDSRSLTYVACDDVSILTSGNPVQYPEATDITANLDSYNATSREWLSVTGVLNGSTLTVEDASNSVSIIDAPASLGLDELNGHRVTLRGYFDGVEAPVLRLIVAEVDDLGLVEQIYFSDDFEWLQPWAENSGAGQTVENDGTGDAPQIYSAKNADGQTAAEALVLQGYGLEQTPGNAIYLQKNYLKFGKTDYQAGLTLPALTEVPAGTSLKLTFDWAPMVGGTRKFDPVQVIVSVTTNGNTVEMEPIGHSFVDTQDKLEWLHAEVVIDGADITPESLISIKSNDWGANEDNTGSKVYRRWFIDNIKLMRAE